MSRHVVVDIRLDPDMDAVAEEAVQILQHAFPAMSVDDALDAIFRTGLNSIVHTLQPIQTLETTS